MTIGNCSHISYFIGYFCHSGGGEAYTDKAVTARGTGLGKIRTIINFVVSAFSMQ